MNIHFGFFWFKHIVWKKAFEEKKKKKKKKIQHKAAEV